MLGLVALCAAAAPQGSMLYIGATSVEPFRLGLFELDLTSLKETVVTADLGGGKTTLGSFGVTGATVMTGAESGSGDQYAVALQSSVPSDPWMPADDCGTECKGGAKCCKSSKVASGACFRVDSCSDQSGGSKSRGVTLGVDLGGSSSKGQVAWLKNTSQCWALAADKTVRLPPACSRRTPPTCTPHPPTSFHGQAGSLLCVEEENCANSSIPCGNNFLHRLDVSSGKEETIGTFPPGDVAAVFAVTMDSSSGIFYVGLDVYEKPFTLYGMDTSSGKIVSTAQGSYTSMLHTLAYDPKADGIFGVASVHTGPASGGNWSLAFGKVSPADLSLTKIAVKPGVLEKYFQVNFGVAAPGVHYFNAFRKDNSLWLVGLDTSSGEVVLEHQRTPPAGVGNPNFVDMAWHN